MLFENAKVRHYEQPSAFRLFSGLLMDDFLLHPDRGNFQLNCLIDNFLNEKKASTKDLSTLIGWGFRLVEYHKKPEYQAALHASPN